MRPCPLRTRTCPPGTHSFNFFGLPNEAQYGFALTGDHGEHGELISRRLQHVDSAMEVTRGSDL